MISLTRISPKVVYSRVDFYNSKGDLTVAKAKDKEKMSDVIRAEIAKIPAIELRDSQPARVLDALKAKGVEITASIRTSTSTLLKEAKGGKKRSAKKAPAKRGRKPGKPNADRAETANPTQLAMDLFIACGNDIAKVHAEIARIAEFSKSIK
jgi:hypothetical protein